MTQMQSQFTNNDVDLYQESERTSVMAILSMIFGFLGCCVGITSLPAILLGIFGLIGISRSKGRVGGTGFGIAGILIGLITLALWGGLIGVSVVGVNTMIDTVGADTEQVFLSVQSGEYDDARSVLDQPASNATDAQMIVFHDGYQDALGEFASKPNGISEMIEGYMAITPLLQPYNGKPGLIPIPMRFDTGWALVIIVSGSTQGPNGMPLASELIVVDAQGNEYRLPGNAIEGDLPIPELPEIDVPDIEEPDSGTDVDDGP